MTSPSVRSAAPRRQWAAGTYVSDTVSEEGHSDGGALVSCQAFYPWLAAT